VAERIVLDELHLTVRIPSKQSKTRTEQIHRRLKGKEFMSRLRRAIRAVFRACPELAIASLSVSR
jgi:hypothetical protein